MFWSTKISWLLTIIKDKKLERKLNANDLEVDLIFYELNKRPDQKQFINYERKPQCNQITFHHVSNSIVSVRDSLTLENKGFFEPTVFVRENLLSNVT